MHSNPSSQHQTFVERIRAAASTKTPLRIRGGGTKDFYTHNQQGELLDASSLGGVVSYEPSELVVTVGAGMRLTELEALLSERGQCLPFEPPHFVWSANSAAPSAATVGGMVASGLAGPARASVGGVRDYVLGLKMINGKGEHLTFGGQVMKNVAGYDVSRVMVGALGTLGLITEVSLKVLPKAPAQATLCFEMDQASALEHLNRWGALPLPLNASCWVHDDADPGRPGRDLLFVRLRGAVAAVEAACAQLLAQNAGTRIDNAVAQADWDACRNQTLPFFAKPQEGASQLWRISVPQTAPVLSLPANPLVEWHGGLRWVWAAPDAATHIRYAAEQVGGGATLFVANDAHSTGVNRLFSSQNPAQLAISQRLKASFDPHGIFNPSLCAHAN